ncbi:MAG: GNAT family N-acetyltransferase [Caldilineales bacterium]|nr:GNAT family N-acetyltransferase [Caldilineales bacterium]
MPSLIPASACSTAALVDVLNAGFQDYAVALHFDPDQYEFFVRSHDIDLDLSLAAHVGGDLIGIAQLGRRGDCGWVAGVSVRPDHRRHGVARALMQALAQHAQEAGLHQLRLEVLYQNDAARQLYEELGWKVERELLTWSRAADQELLPVPDEFITEFDPARLLETCFGWHDQPPCWQRQRATLRHFPRVGLRGWALVREAGPVAGPVAYALGFPPLEGKLRLADVAVDPAVGIRSAGRPLLQALYHSFRQAAPQLGNEPVDSHLNHLFFALGYRVSLRQHEMSLSLKGS